MGFIIVLHVLVCILLVIAILMQAGRGGGLAESFSSAESMFGTQTNTFMVRLSTVLAIIFFCTSLILAVNSSKMDRSLMTRAKLPVKATQKVPQEVPKEPTMKVSTPQPVQSPVITNTTK